MSLVPRPDVRPSALRRFRRAALGHLLHAAAMTLGRSLRVACPGQERHHELLVLHAPLIYAFWHGHQLGLLFLHRFRADLEVLVSLSSDGELLAHALRLAGLSCVRGSSSRGGDLALEELLLRLGRGQSVAITPDGPRGPRHSVAPGVLALARWSGRPIVPVAVAYAQRWQLPSWDGFLLPCPGTRMAVGYGEPIWIPSRPRRGHDDSATLLAARLHALSSELEEVVRR